MTADEYAALLDKLADILSDNGYVVIKPPRRGDGGTWNAQHVLPQPPRKEQP